MPGSCTWAISVQNIRRTLFASDNYALGVLVYTLNYFYSLCPCSPIEIMTSCMHFCFLIHSLHLFVFLIHFGLRKKKIHLIIRVWRASGWLSQLSIWFLISARVMVSLFMGLSPRLGSELMVQSLRGILSLPLSLHFSCSPFPSVSENKEINIKKKSMEK